MIVLVYFCYCMYILLCADWRYYFRCDSIRGFAKMTDVTIYVCLERLDFFEPVNFHLSEQYFPGALLLSQLVITLYKLI